MVVSREGFRFRSSQHLRYSWEFASLKASGQRAFSRTMIMNWRPSSDRPFSRLGVIASKRVGGSVVRSRSRRLMREAFRCLQGQLASPLDIVLVARQRMVGASQQTVVEDLRRLLRRARVFEAGR